MSFNWPAFLDQHNIEYREHGRTATKNNIAINCPFCAHDESFYLSISLDGKGWHCWRNADHKGRSPVKLICELLHCSFEDARGYVGDGVELPTDFLSVVSNYLAPSDKPERDGAILRFPDSFRKFNGRHSAIPYENYLDTRGIWCKDAVRFDLRYCTHGEFRGRIIFPIVHEGRLVSWTGRSISANEPLRYKDAKGTSTKDHLMFFDYLMHSEAHTLVLTEGPFDALKVNALGFYNGVASTCFTTSFPSDRQLGLLHQLMPRFKRSVILLDRNAEASSMRLRSALNPLLVFVKYMPQGLKDPALLNTSQELLNLLA